MTNLTLVEHPLISHWITVLRNKQTRPADFRRAMANVTRHLFFHATEDLPATDVTVETPLASTGGQLIDTEIVLVPILRAGQGMVDPILETVPDALVGYLGMYRDEESLDPVSYYFRLPDISDDSHIFVIDPMLATGGSSSLALTHVKKQTDSTNVTFLCIIAAPEGVERLNDEHPDIHIYTSALDEKLNDDAFIVPGLGDAGDRQYNTL
ncbi:MAG: uracil phosphoribosyltransferase [Candidatus Marinimicrobia bacterium]|nr:uracil phosphoribosyltransferase [Candidatus Neomarinimicrobiota bacterium]MCF7829097.1 uracil phosphoribosyltransferase [Candidatus Neomarinimicrobiota bacterium]MCF7881504.1 uracil phosphoribosyltransferase [Candidatus Neomarinimicrobiota bacterium]